MSRQRCQRKRVTREELLDRVCHLHNLRNAAGSVNLDDAARESTAETFELQLDDYVARCEAQLRYAKKLQADVRDMDELPPALACCGSPFRRFVANNENMRVV